MLERLQRCTSSAMSLNILANAYVKLNHSAAEAVVELIQTLDELHKVVVQIE